MVAWVGNFPYAYTLGDICFAMRLKTVRDGVLL